MRKHDAIDIMKMQSEVEELIEMYEHFIIELEEMKERVVREEYKGLDEFCEHQIQAMKPVLTELVKQLTQTKDVEL